MKELFLIIISMLFSVSKLYQFFIDYKNKKLFVASVELVFAIIFITCTVCVVWNCTLQAIA